jgi:hypothetical protein
MDQRDERERMDPERRSRRYGRGEYGADDYERDGYDGVRRQERSFDPYEVRDQRVFGERERGVDYTSARYGAGGYYGYGGAPEGGRYYGDAGRRIHRDEYRPHSITEGGALWSDRGGYGASRYDGDRGRREHAYRVAYGDHHPEHKRRYEEDDRRSFWERAGDRMAAWFGEGDPKHRGRGPASYKRTDERISEEANELLTEDPWLDASGIEIAVSGGEVTLNGTVSEREAKHRAERLIEDMSGVTHVQNNLRVRRGDPITGSGLGFGDSANEAQMQAAARPTRN